MRRICSSIIVLGCADLTLGPEGVSGHSNVGFYHLAFFLKVAPEETLLCLCPVQAQWCCSASWVLAPVPVLRTAAECQAR